MPIRHGKYGLKLWNILMGWNLMLGDVLTYQLCCHYQHSTLSLRGGGHHRSTLLQVNLGGGAKGGLRINLTFRCATLGMAPINYKEKNVITRLKL